MSDSECQQQKCRGMPQVGLVMLMLTSNYGTQTQDQAAQFKVVSTSHVRWLLSSTLMGRPDCHGDIYKRLLLTLGSPLAATPRLG